MVRAAPETRPEIERLAKEKADQEEFLRLVAQERADLDSFRDWEQSSILWLDELYDLSSRFPWHEDFRVNQLAASTNGTKKGVKDQYVAKIALTGYAPVGQEGYVRDLNAAMSRDLHVRPNFKGARIVGQNLQYEMRIDLARQDAKKFQTRLEVPPDVIRKVKAPAPAKKKGGPPIPDPMAEEDPDNGDPVEGGNP